MPTIKTDERGRILIAKEIRDKYGDEFTLVQAPGELVLIPAVKDPIKSLQEEGKKIPKNISVKHLRAMATELAKNEILKEMEELERKARRRK